MKLKVGVSGPKKLANFGSDPEGEALLAAGKYAEYGRRELDQSVAWMQTQHGSKLDGRRVVYVVAAALCFRSV